MALKPISRIAAGVQASTTLVIDSLFKQMKAEGKDVVGFGAGEPDFDTPEYVRAAAQRAIDEGRTRYTPVPGTLSLRKTIAEKFLKDNGLAYDVSQIIVSSGAKQSLFTDLSVLVNDGDEVLGLGDVRDEGEGEPAPSGDRSSSIFGGSSSGDSSSSGGPDQPPRHHAHFEGGSGSSRHRALVKREAESD